MRRYKTVRPKNHQKIAASRRQNSSSKRVYAAGEDDFDSLEDGFIDPNDNDLYDTLDDVADKVDDIQDSVEEIDEDDVNIDIDNNIVNHYIAECDICHGVFISAVVESDQEVEKVSGVCPLCEKESDQYLKWIVRDAKDKESNIPTL